MINPDILGYLATSLNVVMLVPQVLRTWNTKQTRDLSFVTLLIFLIACILWILYGLENNAIPVIVANSIVGISNLVLIIIKLTNPEKTNL